MPRRSASLLAAAMPTLAAGHEGHGLGGVHWHASDAWGFVIGAAVVAALWFWRRK